LIHVKHSKAAGGGFETDGLANVGTVASLAAGKDD